jgi:HEPN domain-containing protein
MMKAEMSKAIEYWTFVAEHDHKTMLALYKTKQYSNCLFFGHIVLEKILKGLYVKHIGEQAPFTHDLVRLAEDAKLEFSQSEKLFLNEVNQFNIRARYPEKKLVFYKKCTPAYTKNKLEKIETLYKKLCQELQSKK